MRRAQRVPCSVYCAQCAPCSACAVLSVLCSVCAVLSVCRAQCTVLSVCRAQCVPVCASVYCAQCVLWRLVWCGAACDGQFDDRTSIFVVDLFCTQLAGIWHMQCMLT